MASEVGTWKVNTPRLLQEIMCNNGVGIFRIPLTIFQRKLIEIAERAIELDDPQLNQLMLDLALYEQGNPERTE